MAQTYGKYRLSCLPLVLRTFHMQVATNSLC